jgi:hypothetical protein
MACIGPAQEQSLCACSLPEQPSPGALITQQVLVHYLLEFSAEQN